MVHLYSNSGFRNRQRSNLYEQFTGDSWAREHAISRRGFVSREQSRSDAIRKRRLRERKRIRKTAFANFRRSRRNFRMFGLQNRRQDRYRWVISSFDRSGTKSVGTAHYVGKGGIVSWVCR